MAGREYDDLVEVPDDAGKLDEHIGEGGRGGRGGRGRERGKGRGGAAGGAGRGGMSRETQISKALSQLLRHKAESQGISLDEEGFAKLDEVVYSPPFPHLFNLPNPSSIRSRAIHVFIYIKNLS